MSLSIQNNENNNWSSFRINSNKRLNLILWIVELFFHSSLLSFERKIKKKTFNFLSVVTIVNFFSSFQFIREIKSRVEWKKNTRTEFIVKRIEMGPKIVYISKMRMRIEASSHFFCVFCSFWKSFLMLLLSFLIYMTTNFQTMKNSLTKSLSRLLFFALFRLFWIVFIPFSTLSLLVVFHHLNLWTFSTGWKQVTWEEVKTERKFPFCRRSIISTFLPDSWHHAFPI